MSSETENYYVILTLKPANIFLLALLAAQVLSSESPLADVQVVKKLQCCVDVDRIKSVSSYPLNISVI